MVMVIDEIFDLEKKKQDEEIKKQTHEAVQSTLDSLQMGQLKRIKELLDTSPDIKR